MPNKNVRTTRVLLILSLTLAFCSKFGFLQVPQYFTYSWLLIWILVAGCQGVLSHWRHEYRPMLKMFVRQFFGTQLIFYVYTILLVVLGLTEARFLSTNIYSFINALSAISVFYLFKGNAFNSSVIALFFAYIIMMFCSILFGNGSLEFHDLAFGAGMVLLYYAIKARKIRVKDFFWLLLYAVICLAAFKRIGLLALAVSMAISFFLNLFNQVKQRLLLKIVVLCFVTSIYVYIMLVESGNLWLMLNQWDVYVAGRNYYYTVFIEKANFSIAFMGIGRNAMGTLFTDDYAYMNVGNIHSDILRMYAELGFCLFAFWIWRFFVDFPNKIESMSNFEVRKKVVLYTLCLFITYLTDNTELYLVTQYFYILVCLQTLYEGKCSRQRRMLQNNMCREEEIKSGKH